MTLPEAAATLRTHWPRRSFKIGFEFWHHDHSDTGSPHADSGEWAIWDDEARAHRKGPTLAITMALALESRSAPDLALVERQLADLPSEAP